MSIVATLVPLASGATRVRLRVPLNTASTPDVRRELSRIIRSGSEPIVVDMSASTVLDSTGFAALVAAHVRAAHRGRALRVVGADDRTRRLLVRAGLGRLMQEERDRRRPVHGRHVARGSRAAAG